MPGFQAIAHKGRRGIESGFPAYSLLFHAFASRAVVSYRAGGRHHPLKDFPTLAEIKAVEIYKYGAQLAEVKDLFVRVGVA